MGSRTPKLNLDVQVAVRGRELPTRRQLRAWANAALEHDVEAALRIVDESEGLRLNSDYRGRNYATNVLTFAYNEGVQPPPGMPMAGDIVLCAPVVENEAREQGKPLEAHYAHMVVHGMLHLQGYDHEREDEAQAMEARESEILAGLGYPDPYVV